MTSAVKKSYEMVFLAVSQRWPVLLYGPAGAGKTALVARLAQEYGSQGNFLSPFCTAEMLLPYGYFLHDCSNIIILLVKLES